MAKLESDDDCLNDENIRCLQEILNFISKRGKVLSSKDNFALQMEWLELISSGETELMWYIHY